MSRFWKFAALLAINAVLALGVTPRDVAAGGGVCSICWHDVCGVPKHSFWSEVCGPGQPGNDSNLWLDDSHINSILGTCWAPSDEHMACEPD